VNRGQAEDLWRLLCAAYPRSAPTAETKDLWLIRLGELEVEIGTKAIQSLIDGVKFWPAIAELLEQYEIVREQTARRRSEEKRRARDAAADALPRIPLREIPSVLELQARWVEPLSLPEATAGECDDGCGKTGLRFRLGRVSICADCARRRLRARTKGEEAA
jgi:hypothetical protein